jgi:glyoxylase-like metal-dependent hydrolase (beta-lactamase superfamily II)
MITIQKYEDLTIFCMGRGLMGKMIYPVYSYLFGEILIDSGAAVSQKEFLDALKKRTIGIVINTHSHEDHIGNNASLIREKHVKILAHSKALPILANPDQLHLLGFQRFTWGMPLSSIGESIPREIICGTFKLQVIDTPGHSPDHICLLEPQKHWLFSGDLHIGEKTLVANPSDDFNQILVSLKKLLSLQIQEIFCAHQGHLINGVELLKEKIAFFEEIKEKVESLSAQNIPIKEIMVRVAGKEDILAWITRGHMAKINTIKSILGKKWRN